MCIYCHTSRYRKIYEEHFGPIPKDSFGKSFDIHHIDGNRSNNNPSNLIALSRQEHYDIHLQKNDYKACQLLAVRLKMPTEKISELARLSALRLLKENKHNFQKQINPFATRPDGTNMALDRVKAGKNSGLNHPNAKLTRYTFKNDQLGITENLTAYELHIKYKISRSNITQMIKGNRQSVGSWRII